MLCLSLHVKITVMTNTKDLLQKLISIDSSGEDNLNREQEFCDYLESYFKQNFPEFILKRYTTEQGLNNLICFGSKNPKILFACHMDTVPASKKDHTNLVIKDDKAYGLGTKDMKGGIVSSILALEQITQKENVGIVFYSDEEYSQKGIEHITKILKETLTEMPKIIISPESRFNLGYGARGIMVLDIVVKGLRAHSARPHLGKDAIKGLYTIAEYLEQKYSKETELGSTPINIARINGGVLSKDGVIIKHAGSVPDICESTISIRNAHTDLNAQIVKQDILKIANDQDLAVEVTIIDDYFARNVPKEFVDKLVALTKTGLNVDLELGDPKLAGYNDAAILAKDLNCHVLNFGPYGEDNHTANEWVSLKSISETAKILAFWSDNIQNL